MRAFIEHWIQDRQVLLRAETGTHAFTVTRQHQVAGLAVAGVFLLWGLIGSIGWTLTASEVAGYQRMVVRLMAAPEAVAVLPRELDASAESTLSQALLAENRRLEAALAAANAEIVARDDAHAALNSDHALLMTRADALSSRIAGLEDTKATLTTELEVARTDLAEQARIATEADVERDSAVAIANRREADHAEAVRRIAHLEERIEGFQLSIESLEILLAETESARAEADTAYRDTANALDITRADLGETRDSLALSQATVERMRVEAAAFQRERSRFQAEISRRDERIAALLDLQKTLVSDAQRETDDQIRAIRRAFLDTGIEAETMMAEDEAEQGGVGGPLIAIDQADLGLYGEDLVDAIVALQDRRTEAARLGALFDDLPFASPMETYRVTSHFGVRTDPFTKRRAAHHGVDFADRRGASIYSTAPGTVVFAGWKGGYGRVVDIDHGFGITTRYGHLDSIKVSVGTTVDRSTVLGTLGNSGRSTGPHLHYEVRIQDRPVDPLRFIRAGDNVRKG